MPLNEWDKFKVDRWDKDFSDIPCRHGFKRDSFNDCLECLSLPDYRMEAEMKARKSFAQKEREYEDRCFNEYDKRQDERFMDEDAYFLWCLQQEEEDHKIQEWENKRREGH